MELSELIRSRREGLGLSIREVARRAGVSPGAVLRLESGDRQGRMETLDKIARVLGITGDELQSAIGGEALGSREELLNVMGHDVLDLSDEELQRLREYVRYLQWQRRGRTKDDDGG